MTMEEKIDLILEKADKIDMIDMLIEKTAKIDMLIEKTDKIDLILEKVEALEEDVKDLKEDVKDLKEDVKELKARVTALEKNHESINRTLILIEDDTSNKIPALFDGYSFHQQHIEEDEKRLDVLENVVDEHSIRISALEQIN